MRPGKHLRLMYYIDETFIDWIADDFHNNIDVDLEGAAHDAVMDYMRPHLSVLNAVCVDKEIKAQ